LFKRFRDPDCNPFAIRFEQILSSTVLVKLQLDTFNVLTFDGIVGMDVNKGQNEISNEPKEVGKVVTHRFNIEFAKNDIETIVFGNIDVTDEILVFPTNKFVSPKGIIDGKLANGLFETSI
jgi:hypothetical protein